MFLSHRVDITERVTRGQHSLEIDFDSALLRGRELEKAHPEYNFIAHNGETGRLGVRKAQYNWVSIIMRQTMANTDIVRVGIGDQFL